MTGCPLSERQLSWKGQIEEREETAGDGEREREREQWIHLINTHSQGKGLQMWLLLSSDWSIATVISRYLRRALILSTRWVSIVEKTHAQSMTYSFNRTHDAWHVNAVRKSLSLPLDACVYSHEQDRLTISRGVVITEWLDDTRAISEVWVRCMVSDRRTCEKNQ